MAELTEVGHRAPSMATEAERLTMADTPVCSDVLTRHGMVWCNGASPVHAGRAPR